MKLTFVIPGLAGGGPRVLLEYVRGLRNRGHEARILYPQPKPGPRELLREIYLRLRYKTHGNSISSSAGEVRAYTVLTPELVGHNDAIIGVGADCVLDIAGLPANCGLKINNCHGRELHNMDRMRASWQLRMPRIVVSSHLEREMRQQGSTDDIRVVHNGVDRSQYFPLKDQKRQGVGSVYHGAYTKGPELLLSVFQRLHRLRPELPLILFGSYPKPADLPSAVSYTRLPPMHIARALYSSAEVWFCSSRSEGFPGPVLEAMACGCALVSTDCGGPADQIDNAIDGFLVPVDDADQMTGRILELLDNPALRERMVVASQAKLARFTWPNAIRNFESAVGGLVERAAVRNSPASDAARQEMQLPEPQHAI